MKEHKYVQCILCEGESFQEAVDKFNHEMKRLSSFNPTYERAGEKFLIYIKVYDLAPETIAEAKELDGCDYRCKDCVHCERELNRFGVVDKRMKRATCIAGSKPKPTFIHTKACDVFYLEHQDERKEAK